MFDFIIMMKDVVEKPDKLFGIFQKNPEKVMMLPGLVPVFETFIKGVKSLNASGNPDHASGQNRKRIKTLKTANKVIAKTSSVEDVSKKIDNWLKNNQ